MTEKRTKKQKRVLRIIIDWQRVEFPRAADISAKYRKDARGLIKILEDEGYLKQFGPRGRWVAVRGLDGKRPGLPPEENWAAVEKRLSGSGTKTSSLIAIPNRPATPVEQIVRGVGSVLGAFAEKSTVKGIVGGLDVAAGLYRAERE